jgi:N-acetylneuraminic acid mutarotase
MLVVTGVRVYDEARLVGPFVRLVRRWRVTERGRPRAVVGVVVVVALAQGCTGAGSSRTSGSASATAVARSSIPRVAESTTAVPSTAPAAPVAPVTSPPAATSAVSSRGAGSALDATVLPSVLPAAVYRTQAGTVGGFVYLLGGIDAAGVTVAGVYRVDPSTGAVTRAGALATPTHGAAALTFGGRILVFGGAATSVHTTVQAFDPATGQTTVIGRLPGPLADLTAAGVGNQMLLLGGFNGARGLDTILSTTDGTTFHLLGHLAQAVRYPAVAVAGGDVYVFGGLLAGGEYTGTFSTAIQRIDPTRGTTTVVGHLPIPLAHAKAVVLDGQMLVLGGSTTGGPSAAIFRFDPATAQVSKMGTLPEPATDGAVAIVADTAYLLGGISRNPIATIMAIRLLPPGSATP